MLAAVIPFGPVALAALAALDQTLRIAWEDSGPWRRVRFVVYGVILALAALDAWGGLSFGNPRPGSTFLLEVLLLPFLLWAGLWPLGGWRICAALGVGLLVGLAAGSLMAGCLAVLAARLALSSAPE